MKLNKYKVLAALGFLICGADLIYIWINGIRSEQDVFALVLSILLTGLSVISLGILLIVFFRSIYLYLTEDGKRIGRRVLSERPTLPDELLKWEEELLFLGFVPMGAMEIYPSNKPEQFSTVWYYLDGSAHVYADIFKNRSRQFVAFGTNYADGFEHETAYNFKEFGNHDSPTQFSAVIETSIATAYDYHLHQFQRLVSIHGEAKTLRTIEDTFLKPERRKVDMQQLFLRDIKYSLRLILVSVSGLLGGILAFQAYFQLGSAATVVAILWGVSLAILTVDFENSPFTPIDRRRKPKAAE
jgi:hypothetical protein